MKFIYEDSILSNDNSESCDLVVRHGDKEFKLSRGETVETDIVSIGDTITVYSKQELSNKRAEAVEDLLGEGTSNVFNILISGLPIATKKKILNPLVLSCEYKIEREEISFRYSASSFNPAKSKIKKPQITANNEPLSGKLDINSNKFENLLLSSRFKAIFGASIVCLILAVCFGVALSFPNNIYYSVGAVILVSGMGFATYAVDKRQIKKTIKRLENWKTGDGSPAS